MMSHILALVDGGEACFRVSAGSQIVRYRIYPYHDKRDGWIKEFRYARDADKWLKANDFNPDDPQFEREKFVSSGSEVYTKRNTQTFMNDIAKGTECDHILVCFGHPTHNFRHDIAAIQDYKAGRGERPPHYYVVRDYLQEHYAYYESVDWLEDDDVMASFQNKLFHAEDVETVICSQDKDLLQVPGWHYNTRSKELFEVSVVQGLKEFYKQLISGDSTDTIPGIYQLTGKRNSKKFAGEIDAILKEPEDEERAYEYVFQLYNNAFGPGDYQVDAILTEIANLLYLRRAWVDSWHPPGDREIDW